MNPADYGWPDVFVIAVFVVGASLLFVGDIRKAIRRHK